MAMARRRRTAQALSRRRTQAGKGADGDPCLERGAARIGTDSAQFFNFLNYNQRTKFSVFCSKLYVHNLVYYYLFLYRFWSAILMYMESVNFVLGVKKSFHIYFS
jgi:hypothetical protein